MPAQAQGQDRHAKRIGGVDPGLTEREKFVEGQTDIGVEQVKFDATDLKFPNASVNIAVQNPHCHQQRAIVAPDFPDRQMMKVLIKTDGVLDPVLVDFLPEISVSIEQADRDKIQVEVAG